MKRILLSVIMMALTTVTMQAARALSEPVTVQQPDGSTLVMTLYGDEHIHWLTAADGVLLVEKGNAYFVAAVSDKGELSATRILAHDPAVRSVEEKQFCLAQQQKWDLFYQQAGKTVENARRAQVTSTSYFPHTGSPKCLVILANFSDNQFTSSDPVTQFSQYFSGETQENLGYNEQKNLVSVKRYFGLSSHGQFTPQFDIVGPVTLPQTLDYYGADTNTNNGSYDKNFDQFCKDAIAAVDDQVDFHDYDNDGDGRAELVCVIYAGYGQSVSGNPSNTIWPKCGYRAVSTGDGVTVSYMNCSPELYRVSAGTDINGIGLFTHEFSHGMGLPDLYATNTQAQVNNQTPEFWDLMDYGEYDGGGYTPVPYTAWEQAAMGWIEIEELGASQTGIELKPLIQGGKAYKFGNGADSEEWMLIENVQPRDTQDRIPGFRYGHGLLVWHIAYAKSTVSMSDYPNNTAESPRVCIVPADGLVINGYQFGNGKPYTQAEYVASLGGDPFPGTSSMTMLNATQSLPNFKFYNGDETPVPSLLNITEDTTTGIVTFDFDGNPTTIQSTVSDNVSADNSYYLLDGRRISGLPARSGLYIHHGRVFMK